MTRLLVILGVQLVFSGCGDDSATPTTPPPVPPPPPAPPPPPEPGPVPAEIGAWIDANAHPFLGTDPLLPHGDIEFLREMVGDARIVALGENTHGTRDFFEMKFRIFRFLVEEMGFNAFAMESSWPEARLVDRYVRAGEADSAQALVWLGFLVWHTETVLGMLEWMREHNSRGGDVSFHGFDMQNPSMAIANVVDYLVEVDPPRASEVRVLLECLLNRYRDQTDAYRAECGESLATARELLITNRGEYETASGGDTYDVVLQSFRIAEQFHLHITGEQHRDKSMAENTEWIMRRIGPEGRMVLWAHNYHVSTMPETQGGHLRATFGDDMMVLGFTHERGRFTGWDRQGNQFLYDLDPPVAESVEHYLSAASAPPFVLDLREVDENTEGGSWLTESRPTRSIGFAYNPDRPDWGWSSQPVAEIYDLLAHFESTRPTTVLPRRPQSGSGAFRP